MDRFRIVMKETELIYYEFDAYNIDEVLSKSHNWAEQYRESDENNRIIKIELIREGEQ